MWWDGEKRWYEGVVIRYDGNPNLLDSHGIRALVLLSLPCACNEIPVLFRLFLKGHLSACCLYSSHLTIHTTSLPSSFKHTAWLYSTSHTCSNSCSCMVSGMFSPQRVVLLCDLWAILCFVCMRFGSTFMFLMDLQAPLVRFTQ